MGPDPTARRILIVGATSAIATEVARTYAERGAVLILIGRNAQRLAAMAEDLTVRGAPQVETAELDVLATERHAAVVDRAFASGRLDVALIAHGTLPDQARCHEAVCHVCRFV